MNGTIGYERGEVLWVDGSGRLPRGSLGLSLGGLEIR